MKQVSTTNVGGDDAIDRLLRSRASQIRTGGGETCAGFDADTANSYVERLLQPTERSVYEAHLAGCTPCRRAVTSLIKMAEPEAAVSAPAVGGSQPGKSVIDSRERFAWRRFAGTMLRPQWALAAAAIIVLAVTVPFFLSRQSQNLAARDEVASRLPQEVHPARPNAAPAPQAEAAKAVIAANETRTETGPAITRRAAEGGSAAVDLIADGRAKSDKLVEEIETANRAQRREQDEDAKVQAQPAPTPATPAETGSSDRTALQENRKGEATSTATQAKDDVALARIDEKETQRLPQGNKDTEQATVLKQAHAEEEKAKRPDATIRPGDSLPPAAPSSTVELRARGGALTQRPPKLAMRDSGSTSEAVKPKPREERKIHKKRFLLRADVWTDKDYNPLKEMPVITIIRDSDVYREVMTKHGGLKPYFAGFGEHDRAIIVFKGTVYKLIPQDAGK
jgi:hypothetical protein